MMRSGRRFNKVVCVCFAVSVAAGCTTLTPRPDFESAAPQDRFLAIREAKRQGDRTAIDALIRQLSSDDVLIRWAAIDALASLTGERHGYEADASEEARRVAVDRWLAWRSAGGGAGGFGDGS
ncbi:MAG: HEAT repeat domain-containing protein [Phycisphaerales bacterium]